MSLLRGVFLPAGRSGRVGGGRRRWLGRGVRCSAAARGWEGLTITRLKGFTREVKMSVTVIACYH